MALIGRDDDLECVRSSLDIDRRCVVVGTGGIGKTAVARHLADDAVRGGSRVTWIDVEPLDTVDAVAETIARAMGVDALPDEDVRDVAAAAMADASGLVVLDGVEHLAADLAEVVRMWSASTAAVLITSRVPLSGVVPIVRLAPLPLGDDDPVASPAGAMLLRLVRLHGGSTERTESLADAVVATGGLPLAVELAARQIARFGAPFAGSHGAVIDDDVVDLSVDRTLSRLDDDVRRVFGALGWTAGAAELELIAGLAGTDEATTVAALAQLVDHGLIVVRGHTFDLLPPIRDRAARLVAGAAALQSVVEWAAVAVVGDGRDEPTTYRLFDANAGTFMHLAWQAIHGIETSPAAHRDSMAVAAAQLLNALYTPLTARMHVRDLMGLFSQLFVAVDGTGARLPPDLEGHAARYAAMATSEGGTIAAAEAWLDRAETAAGRAERPDVVLGRIWSIRSILSIDSGDLVRGEQFAHRSMAASAEAGERFFVEQSRRHLAEVAMQRGDLDEAERLVEELLSWSRSASVHHTYVATTFIGWIAVERGDRARVAAVARSLRHGLDGHVDYDAQVRLEADLIWLAAEPSRLAETPEWDGDATWWLRLEQRIRRAGALPIAEHWESVLHTAADVVVLADTVPMMQPRLAAGLLLGDAALAGNDVLQARLAFGQVLRDGIRRGYRLRVADALDGIAVLASRTGHDDVVGAVAGAAGHLRDRCGAQPWVRPSLPDRHATVQAVPSHWFVDGHLTVGAADEILRSLGSRPTPTLDAALTKAERHVARLVADGLSNAEIAAHLVVSRRTVESHLVRIFRKCGIKNRTQLARLPLGDGRS